MLRSVQMQEGIKIEMSKAVKDEIVLEGNDLEKLSLSAARVHQSILVKDKDIRKFLDGSAFVYYSYLS
jgi:large subunit ribosomal protein L9e